MALGSAGEASSVPEVSSLASATHLRIKHDFHNNLAPVSVSPSLTATPFVLFVSQSAQFLVMFYFPFRIFVLIRLRM